MTNTITNFFVMKKILKENFVYLIFDLDGVFTDGKFLYDEIGKKYKVFGSYDHFALKNFAKSNLNFKIEVISADTKGFEISKKRVQDDMKLDLKMISEENRSNYISELRSKSPVIFVADSPSDCDSLKISDYSIAPKNAPYEVKKIVNKVLKSNGGEGAVYEALKHLERIINYVKKV